VPESICGSPLRYSPLFLPLQMSSEEDLLIRVRSMQGESATGQTSTLGRATLSWSLAGVRSPVRRRPPRHVNSVDWRLRRVVRIGCKS